MTKKGLRSYREVKVNLILWLMETLVIYKKKFCYLSVTPVWPWSTHTYDFKTTILCFNKAENTEGLPTCHLLSLWSGKMPSLVLILHSQTSSPFILIQGKKLKNKLSPPNFMQHLLFLIITFSHLLLGSGAKTSMLIKALNKKMWKKNFDRFCNL